MTTVTFMTAKEKELVLAAFKRFLKSGLKFEKFTKALYSHLIQHCGFIAHYDRSGFYATYFNGEKDRLVDFFCFFNEYTSQNYGAMKDYDDINTEMRKLIEEYQFPLFAKS